MNSPLTIPPSADSRFMQFKPNPAARLRLFCFPCAGRGALMFHAWSEVLPDYIQICPIQFPGRENRLMEAPATRLLPLVQKLTQVLVHCLDVPYAFFGHSMGGLVGFELIRELRRQQHPLPIHFFVSSCRAPQLLSRTTPFHQYPEPLFIKEVVRRYNGIPEAILQSDELMRMFLPMIRADVELIETYTYTTVEPLECPITAFGGMQDTEVSCDDLEAWRDQTYGPFMLRMFPGDHFYLNDSPETLLRAISQELTLTCRKHAALFGVQPLG